MDYTLHLPASEDDFIQACVNNERWAQKKLYEYHYTTMMGVCLRFANNDDDALDILHEGFIKVFKNLASYNAGTSLSAWMRKIMINTAIDYYRKELRRKTEDLNIAYNLSTNDADAISRLSAEEILKALQQLTVSYRSVFNLYVIEGYSHKEIADILGITESTSRANLVKARAKLKQVLLASGQKI
jgi:RNA polymerase sigma-70 factor (ECF subfamily)